MRKLLVEGCEYKTVHQDLLRDLLRLSTSTYSQVLIPHPPNFTLKSSPLFYMYFWTSFFFWPLRSVARPKMCCSQLWAPITSAAETLLLVSWSYWSLHELMSPNSSSRSTIYHFHFLELAPASFVNLFYWLETIFFISLCCRGHCTACLGTIVECALLTYMTGTASLRHGRP